MGMGSVIEVSYLLLLKNPKQTSEVKSMEVLSGRRYCTTIALPISIKSQVLSISA